MNYTTQYLDIFQQHREVLDGHSVPALNALRDEAAKVLAQAQVNELFAPDYGLNLYRVPSGEMQLPATLCHLPKMSTSLYFFFNDIFAASHTAGRDAQGVVVESFAQAQKNHPEVLEKYLGSVANLEQPEVALNTLLAQDGMLVYVPKGVVAEKPIQLVNVFNAPSAVMAVRRVLVVLDDDAQARMLVCDHTQNPDTQYLSSQVVEIVAGRNAVFDYYDMEESGAHTSRESSIFVAQAEGANVLLDGISLLNGTTRNHCTVQLNGAHAECTLLGMVVASGKQNVSNTTLICHNAPSCKSNEMYKYVLDDNARGAFAGKILVKPGCPHTEAYQGNRNIVATATAKMHSEPQLEIYTDDVQCSHGSATGQLDEEALFYMRQRGISESTARQMLMQAFMTDVVDGVRLPALKDRLHHLLELRFKGELAQCATCKISKQ